MKRSYYNTQITTSDNKIKMMWNIVKSITNRRTVYEELKILKIDRKCIKDCRIISNSLNDYFTSTAIRVNDGKLNIRKLDINHPMEYLYQTFKKPSPSIKFQYTSTKEIKIMITFLNSSNSHGYNAIATKILKLVHSSLIHP
jgi:hypothetical protein